MNRRYAIAAALLFPVLFPVLPPPPASAQSAPGPTAEQAIEQQKKVYGPDRPKLPCGTTDSNGDIVVCATDSKEFRVQPTSELDPTSHEALYDGLPRAPQLDKGSCKGQPGCIVGGWAPPPIYYIDLKAIPEAPEGSDADLIARGEKAAR